MFREFSEMRFVLLLVLTSVLCIGAVPQNADTAAPKSAQAWDAKSIKWQNIDADGTKYALLEGRRDVPGEAFTYAFFIPAGYHEHHWHSADARVAVIQGVLKVSFGESLDLERMTAYPVGSFLLVPANMKHTMSADVDTIIIGTAVGPWATHHHGEHEHP
jgi:quercetin dioxygenase-like cupin family protein